MMKCIACGEEIRQCDETKGVNNEIGYARHLNCDKSKIEAQKRENKIIYERLKQLEEENKAIKHDKQQIEDRADELEKINGSLTRRYDAVLKKLSEFEEKIEGSEEMEPGRIYEVRPKEYGNISSSLYGVGFGILKMSGDTKYTANMFLGQIKVESKEVEIYIHEKRFHELFEVVE